MISRCDLGLPIRIREDGSIDYTDSAFLTGMLSFFGSSVERPTYYIDPSDRLIRHPTGGFEVSHPSKTSRDQLVAWAASNWSNRTFWASLHNHAKRWFINKDFLNPLVRLYLYRRSYSKPPMYLYPAAAIWAFFDLLTHAIVPRFQKVEDQHEINQALCVYHEFGLAKLFLAVHPSPDENMKDYYTRWRDQEEIYLMYLKWKETL